MPKLHLPKEEIASRGKAIYQTQIQSQVEPSYLGKIVAIDINTGEFAIGDNSLHASDIELFIALGLLDQWICHDFRDCEPRS
jgi:hypothetical protein